MSEDGGPTRPPEVAPDGPAAPRSGAASIPDAGRAGEGPGPASAPSSQAYGLDKAVTTGETPEPPAQPLLHVLPWLAGLGLAALLLGRVLGPAVRGVGVGLGPLVQWAGGAGALTSQVFAFAAMMMAILTILAASRSRLPAGVRMAALTLGGFAVLPTVWALHQPVNDLSAALVAASASLLALVVAPTPLRVPFARAPGLVIAFVAMGSLIRLVGVALAFQAGPRVGSVAAAARGIAAAALLCDAVAIAVALTWVASRGKKLHSPMNLVVLAAAMILTRQALAGQSSDAHGFDLLCWRSAVRLLDRPDAALPLGLRIFVAFLAPLAALAVLLARRTPAPLAAGVAMVLAARGAVEMPPCALMLIVGALGVALTARDERALWASLGDAAPRPAAPDRG